jgi:hypothetical protein
MERAVEVARQMIAHLDECNRARWISPPPTRSAILRSNITDALLTFGAAIIASLLAWLLWALIA